MRKIVYLLILLIFLSGCDNSPMGKLKSNTRYTGSDAFWSKECKAKSDLWKEAGAYCQNNKGKPNCADVNFVDMLDKSSKDVTGILNAHPIDSSF